MSSQIVGVSWSNGASPGALVEALSEEALTVAVLAALLEDPELRQKAEEALGNRPPSDAAKSPDRGLTGC